MNDDNLIYNDRAYGYLKAFNYLWHLDDPEWIKQRKVEWKLIKKNEATGCEDATEIKYVGRFYVFGEDVPERMRKPDRVIRFNCGQRFAFTPFRTIEQVQEAWDGYQSHTAYDHCQILYAAGYLWPLEGAKERVKLLCDALYNDQYFLVINPNNKTRKTINPRGFVRSYCRAARLYISRKQDMRLYVVYTVDYYLKCVKHEEVYGDLEEEEPAISDMLSTIAGADFSALDEDRKQFCEEMMDRIKSDSGPTYLKEALKRIGG